MFAQIARAFGLVSKIALAAPVAAPVAKPKVTRPRKPKAAPVAPVAAPAPAPVAKASSKRATRATRATRESADDFELWGAIYPHLESWPLPDGGTGYSFKGRSGPRWTREAILKSPWTVLKIVAPDHRLARLPRPSRAMVSHSGPDRWGQYRPRKLATPPAENT